MYIVGFGEIFIKGQNKNFFERVLKTNIKKALKINENQLLDLHNRYLLITENASNLKYVFGLSFYAKVIEVPFDKIHETALSLVKEEATFKVNCKRITKTYRPSQEVNMDVGGYILDRKPKLKVKLDNPEITIHIEIIKDKAYLYANSEKGLQGLPQGTSNNIFLEISNEKFATVAGFLLMKRGLNIVLSKKLNHLEKFNLNNNIIISKNKKIFIASDKITVPKIKKETIFYPLLGFDKKEIDDLYKKIQEI